MNTTSELVLEAELEAFNLPDEEPIVEPTTFNDADCFRLHGMGVSADDDNRAAQQCAEDASGKCLKLDVAA